MRFILIFSLFFLTTGCESEKFVTQSTLTKCEQENDKLKKICTGDVKENDDLLVQLLKSMEGELKNRELISQKEESIQIANHQLNSLARYDLAFSEFCDHWMPFYCGMTQVRKKELLKLGVRPDSTWQSIFLVINVFIIYLIIIVSVGGWFFFVKPKKAKIELTQKFIDGAQKFNDDRSKSADEAFFKKCASQNEQSEELSQEINDKLSEIECLDDTLGMINNDIESKSIYGEELDAENQRRLAIRETLKFDYEDKMD